jgi:hypothetical protein
MVGTGFPGLAPHVQEHGHSAKSQTQRRTTANPNTDGRPASQRQWAAPASSTRKPSHCGKSQNHSEKNAVPTARAADLTVETLWRIYRARHHFLPDGNFGAWARRIATNLAIDHLRRIKNHGEYFGRTSSRDDGRSARQPAESTNGIVGSLGFAMGGTNHAHYRWNIRGFERWAKGSSRLSECDELDASTQQARKKIDKINLRFFLRYCDEWSCGWGLLCNVPGGSMLFRCKMLSCVPSAM